MCDQTIWVTFLCNFLIFILHIRFAITYVNEFEPLGIILCPLVVSILFSAGSVCGSRSQVEPDKQ